MCIYTGTYTFQAFTPATYASRSPLAALLMELSRSMCWGFNFSYVTRAAAWDVETLALSLSSLPLPFRIDVASTFDTVHLAPSAVPMPATIRSVLALHILLGGGRFLDGGI